MAPSRLNASDKMPPPQPTSNSFRFWRGRGPRLWGGFARPTSARPSRINGTLSLLRECSAAKSPWGFHHSLDIPSNFFTSSAEQVVLGPLLMSADVNEEELSKFSPTGGDAGKRFMGMVLSVDILRKDAIVADL